MLYCFTLYRTNECLVNKSIALGFGCVWVIPSCPKLKRVPEGEVRLELGENGELLAESCSPLVEWERSQSRASSWPRSCGDGPYLQEVKEEVEVEARAQKWNRCTVDSMFLQDKLI